jgi:hypothetical protein
MLCHLTSGKRQHHSWGVSTQPGKKTIGREHENRSAINEDAFRRAAAT